MLLLCRGGVVAGGMGVSLCGGGDGGDDVAFNGLAQLSCDIRSGVNVTVSVRLLRIQKEKRKKLVLRQRSRGVIQLYARKLPICA